MKRSVSAELDVDITVPTTLEFQIAVAAHPQAEVSESLSFVLDGRHIEALEVIGMHGNRIHKFDPPLGSLQVNYTATIVGPSDRAPVTEYDLSMYLRPAATPRPTSSTASRQQNSVTMPTRLRCWKRCHPG
jgi:hypothetical protein